MSNFACMCCGATISDEDEAYKCDKCEDIVCTRCASETWETRGELPEIKCFECWKEEEA